MGITPEGRVKKRVKEILELFPESYWWWPVPAGYGESGLDMMGCHYGQFIAIETKKPGAKPTPRQYLCASRLERAEAMVLMIDGSDEGQYEKLHSLLNYIKNKRISSAVKVDDVQNCLLTQT